MVVYPTLGTMAFPPGVVPNYENPESRAGQLLATNIVCLIIAGTFVSMRIYTQIFLLRAVWWDDCKSWMSSVAQLCQSASREKK
jgi:hypothetical protein